MSGAELSSGLLPSAEMGRPPSLSAASPPPPSRAVGHSQVCIMLILGVGFLLIFSYQSETHTVVLGEEQKGGYGNYAVSSRSISEPLVKKLVQEVWGSSDADSNSSSDPLVKEAVQDFSGSSDSDSTESTERLRTWEGKQLVAAGSGSVEIHNSAVQRSLEAETNSSSEDPAPSPPPPAKKQDWKDIKIEEFKPLVESAHSNIVSSRFRLLIKVLALNDYASISRCLKSLSKAEYAGDEVDIHIYVDHFEIADPERRLLSVAEEGMETEEDLGEMREETEKASSSGFKAERIKRMKERNKLKKFSSRARPGRKLGGVGDSSDDDSKPALVPDRVASGEDSVKSSDWGLVEERLTEARKVLNHVESFHWRYGKKVIHYRTTTAGSQSQWLDAWWPSSDDEFALFVEDDAELSPLFYRYARSLIATYYYQPSQSDRLLYGISLQRPQIVPGKNGQPLKVDDRTRLFKYQMVGIWGQIFFPRPWKEFREWHDSKKSHDVKPVVDGMVTTDWYKQHGEKVFTPWFVKFAYSRGYFNLYTNFLRDRVLSVTHREIEGKPQMYAGCDSVLIWENGTYDIDLWHMAATWHIKRYDYCFKEVRVGRFANYSSDFGWVLNSISQDNKQILMVSTMGVPDVLVRNWLCRIRELGVENYILIGEDPVFLEELARRGHATMRFENKLNLEMNIEKEVSAVSDVLKLGYSMWFTRADALWVGNPMVLDNIDEADMVGLDNSQQNLFFIRSTEQTTPLWESLTNELSNVPSDISRSVNWESARDKFFRTCEEDGKVQIRKLDHVVHIDRDELSVTQTPDSAESGKAQVVVFSGLASLEDYEIAAKGREVELWYLDDDMVCARLTC